MAENVARLRRTAVKPLTKTEQFRQMLLSPRLEFIMEAHNGLSAKIVEETGFKGIWASGLTISSALGVRDSDYAAFAWAPHDSLLDRWLELYHLLTRHNGAEADAGRYLLGWVQAAGYRDVQAMSSTWTFADPESRAWWGGLWADRVEQSSYATQAVEYGLSNADELTAIAAAWRRWAEQSRSLR